MDYEQIIANNEVVGASEMWILRQMQKCSWKDKITNTEVLLRASEKRNIVETKK